MYLKLAINEICEPVSYTHKNKAGKMQYIF